MCVTPYGGVFGDSSGVPSSAHHATDRLLWGPICVHASLPATALNPVGLTWWYRLCSATSPSPCRRFFESLYTALAAVLHEAFDKLGRRELLDTELGRLFRCG
jgi:hypothetical protein